MATHFPVDLLPLILVRLPVKSLLRFRCVSKSWNSLITSSYFITAHINHNDANNCHALLRCYYLETREDSYALHSDNNSLDKITELDFPSETREFFHIIDCANGVVCLMDSYQRYNTVLLWNPSIRKFLTLPNSNYELSTDELMNTTLGFGFDTLNNDYKFIRIYHPNNGTLKMDIFTLSTGCWTDIEIRSSLAPVKTEVATYLDGVLHWLSYNKLIVGFNLGKEKFTEKLVLPAEIDDCFIGVWRGSLSAFETQDRDTYKLWVMKEYGVRESWTKMFEIRGSWIVRGITRDRGLMLFQTFPSRYIDAYDPETRHTKHDILHLKEPLISLEMTPYIESLVLLNEGDNVPTLEPLGI
ncbi:hypothetical protein BVRB_9g225150 [Beta vulgaris subsp. vulgaris]|uniref:F-box domain-containing protein n=1 Tax=Beta vulgaris subsp. vulgaris TaxID=3555 RepID=A0A0J8E031_BETVV|nr:F-box/kelch-repeat protein At3g23880 [Beta vulgaris subsp. vulgaris]KMS96460.1 hypothetical protein BVRB_9g225150 [Beta vulgaris subsp. vulgaris]